jgi:crotonobetainyl-CoA:carnitine CoA-transferase CaiB-like acyl-CoA transferase
MIAGPLAATFFADFGADVIKIEQPRYGDPIRTWAPLEDGVSLWWKMTGRNKRLITLNLSRPAGQDLALELVRRSDIVIENYRPGTLEKWNLGYERLAAINPSVVLVRVSGYGQTGPYRGRPGYGTVAEAMSGIPHFTGFPDRPPTLSAFPLADSVAALFATFAAMFAWYESRRSGHGQVVDVSLFEPLFRLVESQVVGFDHLGFVKERRGNRLDEDSPRNAYQTSDGQYVTISASSPRTFERLATGLGRPDLLSDPRFSDNQGRIANADALDAVLSEWFRARPMADALRVLEQSDVVAGPIYDIRQIFEDPQYRARESIVSVEDPELGRLRMQAAIPFFSRTPGEVRHAGLRIGEHNVAVYRHELGLNEERFAALQDSEII